MNDDFSGIASNAFRDPTCRRPEGISALVFGAELAKSLGATLTDRYQVGPGATDDRRQFATATGATIECDIPAARVVVAGDGYRCDVRMLPDRLAIRYVGTFGAEAIFALYLLDYLHERGDLPTRGDGLSGGQLLLLSDLRAALAENDPEAEVLPAD